MFGWLLRFTGRPQSVWLHGRYKLFLLLHGKERGHLPFSLGFIYFHLSSCWTVISMELTKYCFKHSEDQFANTGLLSDWHPTLTFLSLTFLQAECLHGLWLCFGSSWSSLAWLSQDSLSLVCYQTKGSKSKKCLLSFSCRLGQNY